MLYFEILNVLHVHCLSVNFVNTYYHAFSLIYEHDCWQYFNGYDNNKTALTAYKSIFKFA
jgi:hypothetical protein